MTPTIAAQAQWARMVPQPERRTKATIAALRVLGAAVAMIGIGTPSLWGDEAASVISAQRPLSSLLGELLNIDAVHDPYYLFLKVWIGAAGTSETAVRIPSAVAAGFAIAGQRRSADSSSVYAWGSGAGWQHPAPPHRPVRTAEGAS